MAIRFENYSVDFVGDKDVMLGTIGSPALYSQGQVTVFIRIQLSQGIFHHIFGFVKMKLTLDTFDFLTSYSFQQKARAGPELSG